MKPLLSGQKLRGGYYTPTAISHFLTSWAIRRKGDRILEPSCGDGNFAQEAIVRLLALGASGKEAYQQFAGCELHSEEAAKADQRLRQVSGLRSRSPILVGDFFSHCRTSLAGKRFDAVLGNPPFVRYQNFPENQREVAFQLMREAGLHPNRLTNAWVPFIAQATHMLAPHGRLAMVVPAELLQVNYAAELREFLSTHLSSLTVITFRRLVFDDIQQEVVLLCGERGPDGSNPKTQIRTIELTDLNDLRAFEHRPFLRKDLKPMDHSKEKWTQYFLTGKEIHLLRKFQSMEGLERLGNLAEVNVGVVTGQNEFFVLRKNILGRVGANGNAIRLVSRSGHLEGMVFTNSDWRRNAENDLPAYLLSLPKTPRAELSRQLASYVREGERRKLNRGFKCRIREPWYSVPSVWTPDGFMLRQIHDCPRIIANDADATCTDTIHRVKVKPGVDIKRLAAGSFNSVTFAFSEVMGRSYGGGVLELEPREADSLLVPYASAGKIDVSRLDSLIREGDINVALDYADRILLKNGLGLSDETIRTARSIWVKLRDRRLHRKRKIT